METHIVTKPSQPTKDGAPRVNEGIRADKVRVIDQHGEMLGVLSVKEALQRAAEANLDLVEVSPGAEPPVCKIIDYGKYKFEAQKRANEARKKQKEGQVKIKEIKLRPTIDEHDYQVKLRSTKKFLENGDKVKVTLRFRGREITHQEVAEELFNRMIADLGGAESVKLEQKPKMDGRQMMMVLTPAK
jgi:translation initiation factor IF-3